MGPWFPGRPLGRVQQEPVMKTSRSALWFSLFFLLFLSLNACQGGDQDNGGQNNGEQKQQMQDNQDHNGTQQNNGGQEQNGQQDQKSPEGGGM